MRFLPLILLLLLTAPASAQDGTVQEAFYIDASGDAFVHYNLRQNRLVPAEAADSGGWDVAFKGTTILVRGEVAVVDTSFGDVSEAPESGYASGTADEPAIPTGSGDGWFNYNPSTHEVSPVENRTFVLKLKNGQYAKLQITDYYRQEFTEQGPQPVPRNYSFRFVLSDVDSRTF